MLENLVTLIKWHLLPSWLNRGIWVYHSHILTNKKTLNIDSAKCDVIEWNMRYNFELSPYKGDLQWTLQIQPFSIPFLKRCNHTIETTKCDVIGMLNCHLNRWFTVNFANSTVLHPFSEKVQYSCQKYNLGQYDYIYGSLDTFLSVLITFVLVCYSQRHDSNLRGISSLVLYAILASSKTLIYLSFLLSCFWFLPLVYMKCLEC